MVRPVDRGRAVSVPRTGPSSDRAPRLTRICRDGGTKAKANYPVKHQSLGRSELAAGSFQRESEIHRETD